MGKILLGLDIGTQTIKAVQVSQDKKISTVLAAGYIATPLQGLGSTNPKDEQILADSINRLVHDMKVTTADVSASLPSSKVITRVIEMPLMNDTELLSSIQWEAEQYIPFPLSKVKIDYVVIGRNENTKKMKLLLVAAPITLIEKYMRVIELAGLNPVAFETEILAVGRSINQSFPNLGNLMVVNMGATTSEIALLYDKTMVYSKSYPLGGAILTRTIAQELGFEIPQAEEYKKAYGLDEDKLEGKIARTMSPLLANFWVELEKTVSYFKQQYPNEEMNTAILSGGAVKLPGLVLSVTKNLGIDSQISNPFINMSVDSKILPILTPDAPIYTESVGLALKEVT